ncbi:hypothetical protein RRG08_029343 [Elysia crispata]|uniref:Uncharacterized protein n=1 Tax=Elysia crispata TaxID=231223 RepID=A0AAE1E3E5_9GAST|nr:hypothetical protein RRG08_029343 [Elysia crispata]
MEHGLKMGRQLNQPTCQPSIVLASHSRYSPFTFCSVSKLLTLHQRLVQPLRSTARRRSSHTGQAPAEGPPLGALERFQLQPPLTDNPQPGADCAAQFSRRPGVGLHSENIVLMNKKRHETHLGYGVSSFEE